jgi:hypothetical protein
MNIDRQDEQDNSGTVGFSSNPDFLKAQTRKIVHHPLGPPEADKLETRRHREENANVAFISSTGIP